MSETWGSSARIAPTGDSTYIVHKAELQDIWCPLSQASCCLGQARTRSVRRSRSPTLSLQTRGWLTPPRSAQYIYVWDNKIEVNTPLAICGPATCDDKCIQDSIWTTYCT
eukprot:COSAG04_NODE_73_length_29016_cov_7.345472_2_plen_110_part_00